ncbi:MAG TPA: HlyD family efflux transporter periplasmic adaptor subunit [Puia sp.]|nr:HlyD family efflux transporter periplasmic adaptor subunit [Puia sp.]
MKLIPYLLLIITVAGCTQQEAIRPEHRNIVDAVFASGNIESKSQYHITAYADGYLAQSFVSEADSVRKGQLLFRISDDVQRTQVENAATNYRYALRNASVQSPRIQQLESQIAQARQKKATDSLNFLRYQRLLPSHAVARVDYDNARLAYDASSSNLTVLQKNLEDLRTDLAQNTDNTRSQYRIQQENSAYYQLTSEAPGRILNVYKKNGDLIRKGDIVAELGTGRLLAKLEIAEEDIRRIAPGQRVLVSLNTEKDRIYRATVTKIYPAFDTGQQAFIAEADFDDTPPSLRDGTQLQANIVIGQKDRALVIPTACLLPGDSVILSPSGDHHAVTTGIRTLEWTEILGGIDSSQSLEPVKTMK